MQSDPVQTSTLPDTDEAFATVARDSPSLPYEGTDTFVPDLEGFYTYVDFLRMELKGRWELIKGYLREMSAPRDSHQAAVGVLFLRLGNLLEDRACIVRVSPYGVRLFRNVQGTDTTVVQPDICVICDLSKITAIGCEGAPDMCIEVLSPGNKAHDRLTKTTLYEQAGVREYWIVDTKLARIEQRVLQPSGYYPLPTLYGRGETVESVVVEGFSVSVTDLMDRANRFTGVK